MERVCGCVRMCAASCTITTATQTDTENWSSMLQQVIISGKLTFDPCLASDDIWLHLPAVTGVTELCSTVWCKCSDLRHKCNLFHVDETRWQKVPFQQNTISAAGNSNVEFSGIFVCLFFIIFHSHSRAAEYSPLWNKTTGKNKKVWDIPLARVCHNT